MWETSVVVLVTFSWIMITVAVHRMLGPNATIIMSGIYFALVAVFITGTDKIRIILRNGIQSIQEEEDG